MSEILSAAERQILALHLVPGLGPRLTAALLTRFGSAAEVLRATPAQLAEVPHIGEHTARQLHEAMSRVDVDAEVALLARYRVHLLMLGTPAYPASLATIVDPPHLLYVRGALLSKDASAVALVGSRGCSTYGRRIAERLARGLVHAGFTIVSGLARGIDGVAHRAALEAGGRTIAVLAGGLSSIYPPEHGDLAQEVEQSGAVLTEAAMDQAPQAGMFPARNRLISGLSQAAIIIEAAERSGALITASHAADQGRLVMAVPGPVDSPASGGTNHLIRKGAILVRSVEDVLEELQGTTPSSAAPQAEPEVELEPEHRRIWEFLAKEPRHLDDMAQQLGLNVPQLSGALMMLEMKRVVRRLPGNRYERC
jgi:DNA processing protein